MTRTAPLRDTNDPRDERPLPRAETSGSEEDLALVRRCARRDPEALREIVRRYQPRLFRFLCRLVGSPEDAEEAMQDVFLRVWQQADRFEGRASFATWLYRIAANVANDLLRRRRAQCPTLPLTDQSAITAADPQKEALEILEREERAGRLQRALQQLRAQDRLLLVLYYAEEMEYAEMCRVTGYVYPVLKVRLMRARQRLRAALESFGQDAVE